MENNGSVCNKCKNLTGVASYSSDGICMINVCNCNGSLVNVDDLSKNSNFKSCIDFNPLYDDKVIIEDYKDEKEIRKDDCIHCIHFYSTPMKFPGGECTINKNEKGDNSACGVGNFCKNFIDMKSEQANKMKPRLSNSSIQKLLLQVKDLKNAEDKKGDNNE